MTTLAVGTEKGGFLLRSDADRWEVEGPQFPGWKVTAHGRAADGTFLAAVASPWFGCAVHRSTDLVEWAQVTDGPSWPAGSDRTLGQVWFFHRSGDRLYAGVDDAGLFVSDDHGLTWHPVEGLNEHPSRTSWGGGAGGLCVHHMLSEGDRLWVGISAVGVFRSDDGGRSWIRRDRGVRLVGAPEEGEEGGWCVHGLVGDPADGNNIWRQDHAGVYRTADGGDTWERIERGLPAGFGFPIARDDATGALFVVPLEADVNRLPVDGAFRAYRSTDGGESWHASGAGWPDAPTYTAVLRRAMVADGSGGVYLGTTGGALWATSDSGETWTALPVTLPRILSVAVLET